MSDMFNHFVTTQTIGLCFLGASGATKPPALFHPRIQKVTCARSDFLMWKENKQASSFPLRKTNGFLLFQCGPLPSSRLDIQN